MAEAHLPAVRRQEVIQRAAESKKRFRHR
jgi:hypothetical protein